MKKELYLALSRALKRLPALHWGRLAEGTVCPFGAVSGATFAGSTHRCAGS